MRSLGKLINLRKLNVFGCANITCRGIAEIAKLVQLRELDLGSCVIMTNKGLRLIVNQFVNLRILSLYKCGKINDKGLLDLLKLVFLEKLDLRDSSVSEMGANKIRNELKFCVVFCWR